MAVVVLENQLADVGDVQVMRLSVAEAVESELRILDCEDTFRSLVASGRHRCGRTWLVTVSPTFSGCRRTAEPPGIVRAAEAQVLHGVVISGDVPDSLWRQTPS